mgnify:FL=1
MPSGGTTPKVMSLKAFHLVFVIASILMGIFVGAWGIREYQVSGDIAALILGAVFIALGVFLIVYGRKMLKKTEHIGYLCLLTLLSFEQNTAACAACYGESDSALAKGMNAGILTLLIIVGGLLMGIVAFFVFIYYRSKKAAATQKLLQEPQLLGLKKINLEQPKSYSSNTSYLIQT